MVSPLTGPPPPAFSGACVCLPRLLALTQVCGGGRKRKCRRRKRQDFFERVGYDIRRRRSGHGRTPDRATSGFAKVCYRRGGRATGRRRAISEHGEGAQPYRRCIRHKGAVEPELKADRAGISDCPNRGSGCIDSSTRPVVRLRQNRQKRDDVRFVGSGTVYRFCFRLVPSKTSVLPPPFLPPFNHTFAYVAPARPLRPSSLQGQGPAQVTSTAAASSSFYSASSPCTFYECSSTTASSFCSTSSPCTFYECSSTTAR